MNEIIISQSLIKALDEDKGKCPDKARAIYIEGMDSPPSFAMKKGLFFESVAFGSTDSGQVVQLDRLKSGERSTDEVRLTKQAYRLKTEIRALFKMDWHSPRLHITVPLRMKNAKNAYVLRARTDMVSSIEDITLGGFIEEAIMDFKTTDSIHSNFPAEFAWGVPAGMDHTQANFYSWVYELKFGKRVPFYYIVMDTSTSIDYKVVRKVVSDLNIAEVKQQVRSTVALIDEYMVEGWPVRPSADNCIRCPLSNTCPMYKQGKDIQVVY